MAQGKNRNRRPNQAAAARAVASARGTSNDGLKITLAVVAVVVVAVVVIGGVLLINQKSSNSASGVTSGSAVNAIPVQTVAGSSKYTVTFDKSNATVLAGKPSAKITIDAYEDFICPYCEQFESSYFTALEQNMEAGTIKVRYHMLNLLDDHSSPSGYSSRAANTALAVAETDPAKFIDFHDSLYQSQPQEGTAGWSQAQLTSLANRLGVSGPAFTVAVNGNAYVKAITTDTNNAENNKALWLPGQDGFGTPTIVSGGKVIDTSNGGWLTNLLKNAS